MPKDRFQVCLTLIIYHILTGVLKGQGLNILKFYVTACNSNSFIHFLTEYVYILHNDCLLSVDYKKYFRSPI